MSHKAIMAATIGSFIMTSLATPAMAYQPTTRPAWPDAQQPTPLPAPLPAPGTTRPMPIPERPQIRPPVYPGTGYPGNGYNDDYAGTLRCQSKGYKTKRCSARTENRVRLIQHIAGNCRQGRTWDYDYDSITVRDGCQAEFGYGYRYGGGDNYPYPDRDKDKGPSTGAIIAGVAVAGGLIALLASQGKKKKEATPTEPAAPEKPATFPAGPPAAIVADFAGLPAAARPVANRCMTEAARQIGATGGTRLSYDRLVSLEQGNGGWRIRAALTGTYPDGERAIPMYCRATPSKIIELTFG
ncbi:DUF3011 domain-containing protein [Sphingomonas sp. KC8]|uniref:DUF3011 domain-containing protein n=1 Tax=Sphingomonas sp. KC8 TaxID=1030157 RepID=UPI000A06822D|nr:DUF3011 domain-containing protein [Sphingomonas sp. KC8]ARS27121.1 hypothetical protein KC8_07430 [Sphingomonas sp. KC8]